MYSCECPDYREDYWHCGRCQTDATEDDPEYQTDDCFHCGKSVEIYAPEGSHWYCEVRIGDVYCVHFCDECDSEFLAGPSAPPVHCGEFDEDPRGTRVEWWDAVDIPTEIWMRCESCNMLSSQPDTGDCYCHEDDDFEGPCERFYCATCPNCSTGFSAPSNNLCTPLSTLLRCEREECSGTWAGNDTCPDDYYCPCCEREEVSSWDDEEGDFYCDSCDKFHEDSSEDCSYYDEDEGSTDCGSEDEDEEEHGKTIATFHIDLTQLSGLADWAHFQGTDGDTYLTVPCKSCSQPLHARIGVPNLDVFCGKPFWKGSELSFPSENFPSIEQVYELPDRIYKSDFNKSDFNKGDFNKGDFNKGV